MAVVPATLADDLAKGMGELRAKRLLEVATYETEGFDVAAAGATKTYAKSTTKDKDGVDKTQWKRTAPDAKDLDTTKVEDALFKMGGVEVAEFVDSPKAASDYGLDAPKLKVTVKAKGESWIELGQKDGAFYARRTGDSAILKLDADQGRRAAEGVQRAVASGGPGGAQPPEGSVPLVLAGVSRPLRRLRPASGFGASAAGFAAQVLSSWARRITTEVWGAFWCGPRGVVGVSEIRSAISRPSTTSPKTA